MHSLKSLKQEDYTSLFYIRVKNSSFNILGKYMISDSAFTFKPRFLPDPKLVHTAFVDFDALNRISDLPGGKSGLEVFELAFDPTTDNLTYITSFFPTADTLPSNVLRCYVYFSNAMGLDDPYDHIRVTDSKGKPLTEPFVEIPEGLWDESRTRLTLLFHPGRIKRGVGPNMTKGEVFKEKETYTIELSPQWADGQGRPLKQGFRKTFFIDKAERNSIKIEEWEVNIPQSQTMEPLILKTSRMLDRALIPRMVKVYSKEGIVSGNWSGDTFSHSFIPEHSWGAGDYILKVDPRLEDVSGNTLLSAFDVETGSVTNGQVVSSIEFSIE
ncbi:MAG: hypothetical protein AAGG59_11470 [Bacteroidota bacterium]